MNTALHVFRKDIRRFRSWLALWLVLVATPLVLRAIGPQASFPFMFPRAMLATGVTLATVVLFAVLIVLVVHEDPATSSGAFWLTRPVSAASMWAAKVLFVFLVLVVPVAVVETILLALTGIETKLVALAIPEIVLEWSVWATGLVVLATVTSSLAGMLPALLGAGALRAIAFLAVVTATVLLSQRTLPDFRMMWMMTALRVAGQRVPDLATVVPGIGASRTIVRWTLAIACALAIARVQYGGRRRGSAWALIGAAFILLAVVQVHWRWDLIRGGEFAPRFPSAGPGQDSGVHVTLDRQGVRDSAIVERAREASPSAGTIRARMSIEGVDPPNGAELRRLDGQLTLPDGQTVPIGAAGTLYGESGWDPRAVNALLGSSRLVNLAQEGVTTVPMTITGPASGDALEKWGRVGVRLTATATVTIRAYRLVAELPLQPGAASGQGEHQATIEGLHCQNGDCGVMIRETHISLLLAPSADRVIQKMLFIRVNPDVLYVLRNRGRGEAFWPQYGTTFGFGWITRSRRDETTMVANFRSSVTSGAPLPRLDSDWIAGADLIRIEATPVREVVTQIDVPSFVIDAGSGSSADAGT